MRHCSIGEGEPVPDPRVAYLAERRWKTNERNIWLAATPSERSKFSTVAMPYHWEQ